MVEQQATSTTSVDSDLAISIAKAKVIQEDVAKLSCKKSEEIAKQERERIDVIIGEFSTSMLTELKSDDDRIEGLIALGCNGFTVGWKADTEGDGYLLSFSPTKVITDAPKKK